MLPTPYPTSIKDLDRDSIGENEKLERRDKEKSKIIISRERSSGFKEKWH